MAENENRNLIPEEGDYSQVIAVLTNMFGQIMDANAIDTIVETCDGDLSQSIELIMNMDENEKTTPTSENSPTIDTTQFSTIDDTPTQAFNTPCTTQSITSPQITMSYAKVSKTIGALPKKQDAGPRKTEKLNRPRKSHHHLYIDKVQMARIRDNCKGYRVLIIMRGPPGCGKSVLARKIIDESIGPEDINYKNHIFSSDDYFYIRGKYKFSKDKLKEAHYWNQNRVRGLFEQGFSPIIIDNTNILDWETEFYIRNGVKEGYYIEVVIPKTPWVVNTNQLFKKNIHNVPIETIKKMVSCFVPNTTGEYLITLFRVSYPFDKIPPVYRTIPAVEYKTNLPTSQMHISSETATNELNVSSPITNQVSCNHISNLETIDDIKKDVKINTFETEFGLSKNYNEIEQKLQEINILEQAWENSEKWDDKSSTANEKVAPINTSNPKPQRQLKENQDLSLSPSVKECQDWRTLTAFLPSWTQDATLTLKEDPIPVETISSSTCMEIGDFQNDNNKYKIVACFPRDINMYYMPQKEKIPDKRMLDKSTATNELLISENYRCKNEEKHFVAFRKMFRNIAKPDLRDIFDKCCGDVNWAVEIVLDDVASNQINLNDDVFESDTEDMDDGLCQCTAAYNVIPDVTMSVPENSPTLPENSFQSIQRRKIKKDPSKKAITETANKLKKHFEQNFVISDTHYSQHCLKIKKFRSGQIDTENSTPGTSTSEPKLVPIDSVARASNQDVIYGHHDLQSELDNSEDAATTVNFNLGFDSIRQLDFMFGRKEMTYPSNIVPLVNMPVSILNTLNALWVESLTHQLETQSEYSKILLKQDEDFACELSMKEAEVLDEKKAGKEPTVPDFKLIMDMELALSLYQKNVAEWRNNERDDMATRLTKGKLYDLFPDVSQDVLSELLMAHDNNFQSTVEGLLVSTGQTKILESQNGINKFVMEKEKARYRMQLELEKEKVIEEGNMWLVPEDSQSVTLEMVHRHREWAQNLLNKRNRSIEAARSFMNLGLWDCAEQYSQMAAFFTKQFDNANSIAATCLIQLNAAKIDNSTILDLHLLYVKEAMETLDLFLDHHIQLLRSNHSNRPQIRSCILHVITGRGVHSRGGPKIKPAAKIRLRQRGFDVLDMNPGLVYFHVDITHKMTYELSRPNN